MSKNVIPTIVPRDTRIEPLIVCKSHFHQQFTYIHHRPHPNFRPDIFPLSQGLISVKPCMQQPKFVSQMVSIVGERKVPRHWLTFQNGLDPLESLIKCPGDFCAHAEQAILDESFSEITSPVYHVKVSISRDRLLEPFESLAEEIPEWLSHLLEVRGRQAECQPDRCQGQDLPVQGVGLQPTEAP